MKMQQILKVIAANTASIFREDCDISLPIPVKKAGRLFVLRLIYIARPVPNKGVYVSPPQYTATADAVTGKFISLESADAAKMGVKLDPAHQSWIRVPPDFKDSDAMYAATDRLYDLYDELLPSFSAGVVPGDAQSRQAAQEFKVLFDKLAENTLRDYYDSLGREFFDWLKNVAE